MTEPKPILDLVDVVTEDFEATVAFYKALGAKVEASGGGEHEIWHADVKFANGASLHIDNVALAATYNAAWRREGGSSSVVIGFSVASRDAVDHLYRKLTEDEGYEGRQVPYDAFWGARYAVVADPNGIDVGIMSPVDDSLRRVAAAPVARSVTVDKYAKPEIERRFRLDGVPPDASDPVEITDRYLEGGHLRLRCVRAPGQAPIYKLGHKRRPDPAAPGSVLHTSIYLTEAEHTMLGRLPGQTLRKTRLCIDLDGRAGLVDVFHGPHEGLVLLEVGFAASEDPRAFVPPAWAGAETTLGGGDLA